MLFQYKTIINIYCLRDSLDFLFCFRILVDHFVHKLISVKLKALLCKEWVYILWKNLFGATISSTNGRNQVNYILEDQTLTKFHRSAMFHLTCVFHYCPIHLILELFIHRKESVNHHLYLLHRHSLLLRCISLACSVTKVTQPDHLM